MHTFRDGAPFLLLAEAPPTFRHSLRFFQILHLVPGDYTNLFVTLSPSSFASCGHYLSPRIEIVFLPLSTSVPNFSRLYSFIFLFNTSRSSMYNSHSPTTPVLPSLALPQGHTCASCSSFRPLVYLFLLSGRSSSPKRTSVSTFARSPVGRTSASSFQSLLVISRIYLNIFSLPPYFLTLAFPLFCCPSITSVSNPLNCSMLRISSWLPPISFGALSTTLSHLIPARPFVTFSRTAILAIARKLFFGFLLTVRTPIAISTFSRPYMF